MPNNTKRKMVQKHYSNDDQNCYSKARIRLRQDIINKRNKIEDECIKKEFEDMRYELKWHKAMLSVINL